jgi:hypothetical protein
VGATEDLQAAPATDDDANRFAPSFFGSIVLIAKWLPAITAVLRAVDGEPWRHRARLIDGKHKLVAQALVTLR